MNSAVGTPVTLVPVDLNGDITAWATLAVAATGLAAIGFTGVQLHRGRKASALAIRPLLSDVPDDREKLREMVTFGAPGRNSYEVFTHVLFVNDDGRLQVSVPFRNTGAGVAVIVGARTIPETAKGSVQWTRSIVQVGGHVRVNVSTHGDDGSAVAWGKNWQLVVAISYTDADGGQQLESQAKIRRYQTTGVFLETISVCHYGEDHPFIASGPAFKP